MKALRGFILFVILVILVDRGVGTVFQRMYARIDGGESGGLINRALARKSEVLLLGSSRMKHHVQPTVLKEKLGMSVYNAGVNGQDFLYAAMLMDMWGRSNTPPKLVVLHVDQGSFVKNDSELRRANVFSFYLDRSPLVREVLCKQNVFERWKYLSLAYRANGKVLSIVKNLLSRSDPKNDGFEGLTGSMSSSSEVPKPARSEKPVEFWPKKMAWFDSLAKYCREHGVRFVLLTSPRYSEDEHLDAQWKGQLLKHLERFPEVEFLDLTQQRHPELFARKPELFQDNSHLNAKGAALFSELLASELQSPHPSVPIPSQARQ